MLIHASAASAQVEEISFESADCLVSISFFYFFFKVIFVSVFVDGAPERLELFSVVARSRWEEH